MAYKVLLVEDEAALQHAMGEALRSAGFEVLSATDGEQAMLMGAGEKPDIVLLDLILPKHSGFDVLEALKKNPATEHIPVIVLTNLESAVEIDRAVSLGADSYLVKANYEVKEIIDKVRQVLSMGGS